MSLVTNATLVVPWASKELAEVLTSPLPFDERGQSFRQLDGDGAGGFKGYSHRVFAAGFNYVLPSDLVDWLDTVLGDADATLVVCMEDDPTVHIWPKPPAPTLGYVRGPGKPPRSRR